MYMLHLLSCPLWALELQNRPSLFFGWMAYKAAKLGFSYIRHRILQMSIN